MAFAHCVILKSHVGSYLGLHNYLTVMLRSVRGSDLSSLAKALGRADTTRITKKPCVVSP